MSGPDSAGVHPLTMRWYVAAWRTDSRACVHRLRAPMNGCVRTTAVAACVFGVAVSIGTFPGPPGTTRGRWYDFGRRLGRYTVAGWRTLRPVPLSTGWVYGGGRHRIGISVTIASRTFAVAQLATRSEWREMLAREEARKAL